MKKFFAALLAAALTTGLTTQTYAVDADYGTFGEESVCHIEYLETPIELALDGSFAIDSLGANIFSIAPMSLTSLPSYMWGAYNASDGSSYIQINSGTNVAFRGSVQSYGHVFCSGTVRTAYYDPTKTSDNFSVGYSSYYTYSGSSYTYHGSNIDIIGTYNNSKKTITINSIVYYYQ